MIRFRCECGEEMHASEESAGRQAVCPACGRAQIVPAAHTEAIQVVEAAPPTAAPEAIRRQRPRLSSDFEDESADRVVGTSGKATVSLILGILSLFCNVLAGLPSVILGILALGDIRRSRERLGGHGLAIAGITTACIGTALSCVALIFIFPALLLPAVQKVRESAARLESQNNLKQISIAMHNYAALYDHFPAAAICDKNGKPLLSWRVALLPLLGEQNLYSQFHLNEPWNSPHNRQLLAQMPKVYRLPGDTTTPTDQTHYQVFVGNGAAFEKTSGPRVVDFTDGSTNTILVVEAAQGVPWTQPEDLPFDPNMPIAPLLSTHFRTGCNVAAADAAVHVLPPATSEATLRGLITRNGNEFISWP